MISVRSRFDEELEHLKASALRMGEFVGNMLADSLEALFSQNVALARDVRERDAVADEMDEAIETAATHLLALQQPMAGDLRAVTAALKVVTDLERIGDYAVAVARVALALSEEVFFKPLDDTRRMADLAMEIVRRAMHAFALGDLELAIEVRRSDKAIDALWHALEIELIEHMRSRPETIPQATRLMLVARYLERVGDHAQNICERVAYMETGSRKPWRKARPQQEPPPA